LYATIPEAKTMQLESDPAFPALLADIQPVGATTQGFVSAVLSFVPARLGAVQDHQDQVLQATDFLDHYPSLCGWQFNPSGAALPVVTGGLPDFAAITVYWPYSQSPAAPIADQVVTAYRGRTHYVFPAVGGNAGSLHPLLAWWGVLYALSVVARYEPEGWFKAVAIDRRGNRVVRARGNRRRQGRTRSPGIRP
jgi:hypothetical protein